MIVEISNSVYQLILGIPVDVLWTAKSKGQFGSVSFFLPRSSPAWGSPAIREDGGSLVKVSDGESVWTGILDEPKPEDEGMSLSALEIGKWIERRELAVRREFRGCTPDVIARRAIQDGFIGTGVLPVTIGPCAIAAPLIPYYAFDGKKMVRDVLNYLQQETGQEWEIDHRTYEFRWQVQTGRYHEGLLIDQGDLLPSIQIGKLEDRYQQVTEIDQRTKRSFTAWNMTTPPLWPAQKILEV